ncbi:MAG: assimilatory sulfite reductase (NADPH) flavoprotein subunit [Candidatus Thiodiazotropha sp. DIVDIV]
MEVVAKTTESFPANPLDDMQLSGLQHAIQSLNNEQLVWASGYLAGLVSLQPNGKVAANESTALTVLYATQGGNALSVAKSLAEHAQDQGYALRLVSADNYRPRDLAKEQLLIVVISTQGEGEPPESAFELFKYLRSNKSARLEKLRYAIFGLGDSSYEHFCHASRELDQLLTTKGAETLVERIDADVDFQHHYTDWQREILHSVEKVQPLDQAKIIPILRAATVRHDRNNPFQAELLERRCITTEDALTEVHHLAFEIDPTVIQYQPGDALGLFFRNDPTQIEKILSHTGLEGSTNVSLEQHKVSLSQALTERLELTQLHPNVVKSWTSIANNSDLNAIVKDQESLRSFVKNRQFIDLITNYPADLDEQALVNLLHSQQPRLYSIASSQNSIEEEIHLTVAALRYQHHNPNHLGGASGYLTQRINEGDSLGVYVVKNPSFKLPEATDTPIIMVGAGTGIAPYRAFLQEREALNSSGKNWLVFGNRHFHRDFLYQTDWLNYRKSSLLNRISLAFSQDARERTYVQAKLYEERTELYHWLQEGAHLYVCGGVEMEKGVHHSLIAIAQDQGGLDEESAAEYIDSLRVQGRYQRDVY